MNLAEIAVELENEAKRIRDLERCERLPVQVIGLNGARAKLKAALDGEEFKIAMTLSESKTYRKAKETTAEVTWTVRLEYKNYDGPTLADAVNAALKSLEPKASSDVDDAVAVVEEAFAEPLPL